MYYKIENYPGKIGARKITKEDLEELDRHYSEDFDEIFENMKKRGIISKNHKKENGNKTS